VNDQQASISQRLAERIASLDGAGVAPAVREVAERVLIDVVGLCVAARHSAYVAAALAAWPEPGAATSIGHAAGMSAAGAAFINGTGGARRGLR
jgi:2-methylcitrate dehydratase PrpD